MPCSHLQPCPTSPSHRAMSSASELPGGSGSSGSHGTALKCFISSWRGIDREVRYGMGKPTSCMPRCSALHGAAHCPHSSGTWVWDSHAASPHPGTTPGCSTGLRGARGGGMAQHHTDPSITPTPVSHRPQHPAHPPTDQAGAGCRQCLGNREAGRWTPLQAPYGCPPRGPLPHCVTQQGCSRMGTGSSMPQLVDRGTGPREEELMWQGWHGELKART